MLKNNKYLVYDFNNLKQTALHCACQRGHKEVVTILLSMKPFVDKLDMIGRNPIFFAAKYNHHAVVKMMLAAKAKPGIKNNQGKSSLDVCTDRETMAFLKKGFLLSICLPLVKY